MTAKNCPSCSRTFDCQRGLRVHHTQTHSEKLQTEECAHPACSEEHNNRKYCSHECRSDHLKTQEEWKSAVKDGLPSNHSKGQENWNYGKTGEEHPAFGTERSKEVRQKMGPEQGSSHFAWKPGTDVGFGPLWYKQRTRAIERDGHQCVVCESEENLEVHHVTPRRFVYYHPFLSWENVNKLENLVTMCKTHHKQAEQNSEFDKHYPEEVSGIGGDVQW